MKMLKRLTKKHIYIFIIVIAILISLLYALNIAFKKTIDTITVSYIIAYILIPLKKIIKNKKIKDSTASILILGGIITIISIIVIFAFPAIFKEAPNFEQDIINIIETVKSKIISLNIVSESYIKYIFDELNNKILEVTGALTNKSIDYFIIIGKNLISLAVIPIIVYYFLCDNEKISHKFYSFIPSSKRNLIKSICKDINKLLQRYIVSQLFLSLIVAICTLIILVIFKVKFFVILSVFNGVLNIIPYFGSVLGAIPIILISFLESPTKGLWVTSLLFIVQQIEGNILSPKITGNSINMHPLIIIILLIIGENFGGFIGMIVAVPLGVILKVIYEDVNYYVF
ncbi:AI-2E family transporter [uncultured Clostridium sp.]|uniref:AI-2E family transporter n=1 Tax=uncultured Clostridium sp. TaxID=59620 RepID=UPI0025F3B7F3|nr:AI-2E family transporter [uncultured Clostridium sp.]